MNAGKDCHEGMSNSSNNKKKKKKKKKNHKREGKSQIKNIHKVQKQVYFRLTQARSPQTRS